MQHTLKMMELDFAAILIGYGFVRPEARRLAAQLVAESVKFSKNEGSTPIRLAGFDSKPLMTRKRKQLSAGYLQACGKS